MSVQWRELTTKERRMREIAMEKRGVRRRRRQRKEAAWRHTRAPRDTPAQSA
jgi:hypothetical protein